ncbi:GNAT family N-acetyltransferase [Pseudovibrio sp. Tun.PSC04-5.I4]|uniref:GNAT family N-acetyltransferase n=1 Tax=Pseudovibrio sp. Tun.PSC04-5.I4 TaxID=1798213 RepID=UPI00088F4F93|nr:GNAT family N-acetyltransferase [Pseudovibrio sp. Tun.PSC04-5.I4]SDR22761.1 Protein N-acetyltransferase, RimJ/RimL family [Pseudovibrio sp. Tun.PSC04-5.I4]
MTSFPRLRTASLVLREWKESDLLVVFKHLQNQNVTRMLASAPYPYTVADAEAFLSRFMPFDPSKAVNWAIELNGEAVGGCGAGHLQETPEVGFWLAESHWKKGIMFEALSEMLRYFLLERELPTIAADAFTDNPGSLGLLRKVGFVSQGFNMGRSRARLAGDYPTEEFAITPLDFIGAKSLRAKEAAQ